MNLILGRWDGVPCCGLCAGSLTFNFHIIQIILVSLLTSMHSTLSVCSWTVYPVGQNTSAGQYMGKISFALTMFSDRLFTSLEVITSLGNVSVFFSFIFFLCSNNSILPNSRHVPMEDWSCPFTAVLGLQLHIVLEQELELLVCLMYSSCQICVLGQVIYQCPSL